MVAEITLNFVVSNSLNLDDDRTKPMNQKLSILKEDVNNM